MQNLPYISEGLVFGLGALALIGAWALIGVYNHLSGRLAELEDKERRANRD